MNGGVWMNANLEYVQNVLPTLSGDRVDKVFVLVKELESEQKASKKTEVMDAIKRLRGSLKNEGKTLEEYRAERLSKYEDIS